MSRGVLSKNHFFCDLKSATDHDQLLKQGYKHIIIFSEDPRSIFSFCDEKKPMKFDSVIHFFAKDSEKFDIGRTINEVATYIKNLKKEFKLSDDAKFCFVSPNGNHRAPVVALGCLIKQDFMHTLEKTALRKFLDENFHMHKEWKDVLCTMISQKGEEKKTYTSKSEAK